ncbi:MAG: hypothetical protein WC205_02310 [Opitutaceae bacterium]|jgi:multidrug efflux pump subunit AcrA (membrane-fusion protein)
MAVNGVGGLSAAPAVGGGDELVRLRASLADSEARMHSLIDDNRRLNNEVKMSVVVLGNLRRELELVRGKSAKMVSGQTEQSDRKRISELETTLASVRGAADQADARARSDADESRRVIAQLKKRLDEAVAEPVLLRAQLVASEQALATARTQSAADKKRGEMR